MKQTFPVVFNEKTLKELKNKMFVGVGGESTEYIVGETILNPESPTEQATWYRAARVSLIDDFESLCDFLIKGETDQAVNLAYSIKEYLIEADSSCRETVKRFKARLKEMTE